MKIDGGKLSKERLEASMPKGFRETRVNDVHCLFVCYKYRETKLSDIPS